MVDSLIVWDSYACIYRSVVSISCVVFPYQLSNTTAQFLVTVVTNLPIADIQDALTQQLQSASSALSIGLPIIVSNIERYGRYSLDRCNNM